MDEKVKDNVLPCQEFSEFKVSSPDTHYTELYVVVDVLGCIAAEESH